MIGGYLQNPFKEYLKQQKVKLHRRPGDPIQQKSSVLQDVMGLVVLLMVVYFLLSILNSLAQAYHKRLCQQERAKNRWNFLTNEISRTSLRKFNFLLRLLSFPWQWLNIDPALTSLIPFPVFDPFSLYFLPNILSFLFCQLFSAALCLLWAAHPSFVSDTLTINLVALQSLRFCDVQVFSISSLVRAFLDVFIHIRVCHFLKN